MESYNELIKRETIAKTKAYDLLEKYLDLDRKQIRDAVQYAAQAKAIRLAWPGNKLESQPFLDWAGEKWPELHTALKMPFKVKPLSIEPGGFPSPRILAFPPDDLMKAGYEEKCREIWGLQDQIQELLARIGDLEPDALKWRQQQENGRKAHRKD